uniref:EAL domain-containing protein n=1 Tax=Selenobaculum sp. TaxID=3074374 RepID=UPI003AB2AEB0
NSALESGQFEFYLQPKCSIDTGNIVGAEALVRWRHPMKGLISPGKFIPVFEKNGFILKLDVYIWESVCKLLRQWIDEGRQPMPISVNVSRINLYNPKLCDILIGLVEKYQLEPYLLELELTESAYTENEKLLVSIIERLRGYGFRILMDDFGSGYSSLNILKNLPVDVLKIDLHFLGGSDKFNRGGNILTSVVRMAKWMALPVIVEGVETREQVDFLCSIACTTAQGYYFSPPIPVLDYEKMLDSSVKCNENLSITFETDMQLKNFWDQNSGKNVLFNTLIGAVAIYELCQDNLEMLRANDDYFKMVEWSREDFFAKSHKILDYIHHDDRKNILKIFYEAVGMREILTCKFRRFISGDKYIWIHAKIRFIAGSHDRFLFFAVMEKTLNVF